MGWPAPIVMRPICTDRVGFLLISTKALPLATLTLPHSIERPRRFPFQNDSRPAHPGDTPHAIRPRSPRCSLRARNTPKRGQRWPNLRGNRGEDVAGASIGVPDRRRSSPAGGSRLLGRTGMGGGRLVGPPRPTARPRAKLVFLRPSSIPMWPTSEAMPWSLAASLAVCQNPCAIATPTVCSRFLRGPKCAASISPIVQPSWAMRRSVNGALHRWACGGSTLPA